MYMFTYNILSYFYRGVGVVAVTGLQLRLVVGPQLELVRVCARSHEHRLHDRDAVVCKKISRKITKYHRILKYIEVFQKYIYMYTR